MGTEESVPIFSDGAGAGRMRLRGMSGSARSAGVLECFDSSMPRHAELKRMRRRLRSPAGRRMYARRKALVEPVWGVLKQQRGMRQFRLRGLAKVGIELALAALAYNLTRLHHLAKT